MSWPKNAALVHGGARRGRRLPEYGVWAKMRERCSKPNSRSYQDYGGRGIRVCDRWQSFAAFYEDMGPRPSDAHTIERIDNDGHYCPSNCEWIPKSQQSANRRPFTPKTHCKRGHPLAGENLDVTPAGKRQCKECRRAALRRMYRRRILDDV